MDGKFTDRTQYKDMYAQFVKIEELIDLENGDYSIGFQMIKEDGKPDSVITYYRLSEVHLEYWEDEK